MGAVHSLHPTANQVDELIEEAIALQAKIDEARGDLADIKDSLAKMAQFPVGKNTAHLNGQHFSAKIQRKISIKWDQRGLEVARDAMGDQAFFGVFGWKIEPRSKKDLDGFLAHGDPKFVAEVKKAMTTSEAAPSVSFERIEA